MLLHDAVRRLRHFGTGTLFGLFLLPAAPALAQEQQEASRPVSLDVPYVPTPDSVVRRMLDLAAVGPTDFVVDLGSGDGRIPVTAARDYGVRGAYGVDLNPERVKEANENAEQAKVTDRVRFEIKDLFETDFTQATVLTMYLLPDVNLRLRPVILDKLAPGARVVSHAFTMGDWDPDARDALEDRYMVYLWVVPAKLAGTWEVQDGGQTFTLNLTQEYQDLSGTARIGERDVPVRHGMIRGHEFRFELGEGDQLRRYAGRLVGEHDVLALHEPDAVIGWRATRRQ